MTNSYRRITDKIVVADYVRQRWRSDGDKMQPSTVMGKDNGE
jgi:hypothetical protein